ncbi:hypothetical protein [Winogradskyella pulchriflava]|uniref:Uncharacterized protein n=1 Tax=Winogradskyella pulchriflava TaxID=1110688 RepID=A0ABV6Q483_9FLAO
MKKIILLILILKCGIGISQTEFPFYEQIAFDFYESTLIDSFPTKKKVKVYKYATEFHTGVFSLHNTFTTPNCLNNITWISNDQFKVIESYIENQMQVDSNLFELDFSNLDKTKFKVKKNGKGNYPKLFITPPNKEENGTERIFVNIYEKHSEKTVNYHFEFNKTGEIIDWCRTVDEIIRIK